MTNGGSMIVSMSAYTGYFIPSENNLIEKVLHDIMSNQSSC